MMCKLHKTLALLQMSKQSGSNWLKAFNCCNPLYLTSTNVQFFTVCRVEGCELGRETYTDLNPLCVPGTQIYKCIHGLTPNHRRCSVPALQLHDVLVKYYTLKISELCVLMHNTVLFAFILS